jgi:hypothetical protein
MCCCCLLVLWLLLLMPCCLLLQWVVAVAIDPSMQPADWQEAFDTLLDNATSNSSVTQLN